MEQVLILSYFYPPCNLTAGQRVKGWTDFLNESGFQPIVVTRNWDLAINSPEDVLKSTGDSIKIVSTDTFKVFYLPYKSGFRDRFYIRFKGSRVQKLSKILTFFELFMENFSTRFIPHRNLYVYSRKLLKENPEIKKVIITANPFNLFYFGYLLKCEFDIEWIADYRDDWNTSDIVHRSKSGVLAFIQHLQRKSEKKWLSNSKYITSVSPIYAEKISNYVNKKGYVILNGYEVDIEKNVQSLNSNKFILTYTGTLYQSQPIEEFLSVIGELIILYKNRITIELHFPGLSFDESQTKRVQHLTYNYKENVFITNRISKKDVLNIQKTSDILIMISHKGIKGVPSSKLYEYIGIEKPILLYPNDNDIINETLINLNLGIICDSEKEIFKKLTNLIDLKMQGKPLLGKIDNNKIKNHSRQNQTKVLAKLLGSF